MPLVSLGLAGSILLCLPGLRADTVYLKNGSWIDGRVKSRSQQAVVIEIGKIGKLEIKAEEIYEIEKNNRTGEDTLKRHHDVDDVVERLTREGKRKASRQQQDGGGAAAPGGAPAGAELDRPGKKEDAPLDPELKKRIDSLVFDLQRQKARYRTRAERQLKAIGSAVVPSLLPLVDHDSDLTRIAVFRVLNEVGDDRCIMACIDGLEDSNEYVRDLANKTLMQVTGENFGYHSQASPRRREQAQVKWLEWWKGEQEKQAEKQRQLLEDASRKAGDASGQGGPEGASSPRPGQSPRRGR